MSADHKAVEKKPALKTSKLLSFNIKYGYIFFVANYSITNCYQPGILALTMKHPKMPKMFDHPNGSEQCIL